MNAQIMPHGQARPWLCGLCQQIIEEGTRYVVHSGAVNPMRHETCPERRGAYCVHCRAFVAWERLLPLKGRRIVQPESAAQLGQEVGRCPLHARLPAGICCYVTTGGYTR